MRSRPGENHHTPQRSEVGSSPRWKLWSARSFAWLTPDELIGLAGGNARSMADSPPDRNGLLGLWDRSGRSWLPVPRPPRIVDRVATLPEFENSVGSQVRPGLDEPGRPAD